MIQKRAKLQVTVGTEPSKEIEIHNMNVSKPYREYDVKCDRSSPLGSPFYLAGDESKREEVCDNYASWFKISVLSRRNWEAYEELMRLRDLYRKHGRLRLFCWCKPKRCHVETIKKWLEENN